MSGILDMLMHIADENAKGARSKLNANGGIVTSAFLEKKEWEAFKARLERRRKLLLDGFRPIGPCSDDEPDDVLADTEEDDVDLLLALVAILEKARDARLMLTVAETVRALQREKVLSLESPAAARAQAQRMLEKLRQLNRVWADPKGRWGLL